MSKLLCAIFGHRYYLTRRFGHIARQVGYRRCKQLWGMHDGACAFVPWDGELEALHAGDLR